MTDAAFDDDWDVPSLVRAGGGIVTRPGPAGLAEILIVHRPKYDDWTLPKGKVEEASGETGEQAAIREVEEETGLRCHLGRPAGSTRYVDHRGREKVARYWEMTVAGGRFVPTEEVDQIRWLTVEEALAVLSYGHDRHLLALWERHA